jgi:glycosyltransferase involved in cell wall biosynthesis
MLSFLVPAYNCEDTVAEAVQSALAQDLSEDAEIVVVDDGSADDTPSVLASLADRHPQVRVHRHPENRGGGAARNTAAAHASGELLYMLDSDNVLPPGCVEAQISALRARGASVASVASLQYFDGATGDRRHRWELAQDRGWSTLRHAFETLQVPAAHGNYLFAREAFDVVGGYEPDLGAMDAWSFGFKQLAHGFDVALAPGTHYLHRIAPPERASYWVREQHKGSNDRNALLAVRRQRERLPTDLRAKVDSLDDRTPFFALVESGAFRPEIGEDAFARHVADASTRQRGSLAGRLRSRAGRLLRR